MEFKRLQRLRQQEQQQGQEQGQGQGQGQQPQTTQESGAAPAAPAGGPFEGPEGLEGPSDPSSAAAPHGVGVKKRRDRSQHQLNKLLRLTPVVREHINVCKVLPSLAPSHNPHLTLTSHQRVQGAARP